MRGSVRTFVWAALCLASCTVHHERKAEGGVLDLRGRDWSEPLALDGQWRFYWQEFIDPSLPFEEGPAIEVPGKWNDYRTQNGLAGGRGYATYRLKILLGQSPPLALRILHFDTTYAVFVNGRLLHSEGKPGKTEGESKPDRRPIVLDLPLDESLDLVIHVERRDDGRCEVG